MFVRENDREDKRQKSWMYAVHYKCNHQYTCVFLYQCTYYYLNTLQPLSVPFASLALLNPDNANDDVGAIFG